MKKVFLGLPVYGGYDPHFITSLLGLVAAPPCEMVIHPLIGESLVARARNRIAARFLQSDCSHLLFLDTDLIFSVEHLTRLLSHDDAIVAGLYPKKQKELAWVCNLLPGTEADERGLQPVRYAGTGCLLIAREVFEDMRDYLPELAYDPDDGDDPGEKWDFFRCGVYLCPESGLRRYLSEDWWFCQMARDLGYEIMMDTGVVLKHVGQIAYPLDSLDQFQIPHP